MLLMEVFWGMGLLFLVLWLGGGLMAALRRDVLGMQAKRSRDSMERSRELLMKAGEGSVGLVIAHPDDEAMFFTPTIMSLLASMKQTSSRPKFRVLCLSSGNHDGLGEVRKRELKESCAVLGLLEGGSSTADEVVSIIDDPELPDHPGLLWSYNKVAQHMESWIEANNITLLLTFDEIGVSNHPNHRSVYEATRLLLRRRQHQHRAALASPPNPTPASTSTASTSATSASTAPRLPAPLQAYALVSLPLYRKYLGLLDAWLLASLQQRVGSLTFWAPAIDSSKVAMEAHRSQLVWFRHLFVLFSSYSFVNHLRPIGYASLTMTKTRSGG